MRTVFFGSPDFALPCLATLAQKTEVVAVVCQPDKPAGRGLGLLPPPVKVAAQAASLVVHQPVSLRPNKSDFEKTLRALAPELVVVVAYGKILPKELLTIPKYGCWNVHGSLLPRYRGAAPIQWALISGEPETGVTLMQMDEGMDTGPTFYESRLAITEEDTGGSLHEKLSQLGATLLGRGLTDLLSGTLPNPTPQEGSLATYAPMLEKEHGRVDFHRPAPLVSCQIRGVTPWPGAFTTVKKNGEDVVLKVFGPRPSAGSGRPGEVLFVDKAGLHVACGQGALVLTELQLPSRKRLSAQAVLSGFAIEPGTLLGSRE